MRLVAATTSDDGLAEGSAGARRTEVEAGGGGAQEAGGLGDEVGGRLGILPASPAAVAEGEVAVGAEPRASLASAAAAAGEAVGAEVADAMEEGGEARLMLG